LSDLQSRGFTMSGKSSTTLWWYMSSTDVNCELISELRTQTNWEHLWDTLHRLCRYMVVEIHMISSLT
jgi:hypothetical protein